MRWLPFFIVLILAGCATVDRRPLQKTEVVTQTFYTSEQGLTIVIEWHDGRKRVIELSHELALALANTIQVNPPVEEEAELTETE